MYPGWAARRRAFEDQVNHLSRYSWITPSHSRSGSRSPSPATALRKLYSKFSHDGQFQGVATVVVC